MFSIRCFTFLNRLKTWKQRPFHVGLTQLRDIKVKEVLHQDFVEVGWTDGKNSRFPFVYLREKCQCPACYHKPSSQRILHMKNLDLNSRPLATHIKENGTKIEIVWQDEHVSEFESDWLYKKILPKANTSEQSMIREGVKIWDRNLVIPTFGFEPMLKDEHVLLDWLETMRKYGVAKVTGVPKTLGQLERLGNAVGFLKNTLYGESVSLKSEANARSLAYTNKELQPHTDLPYYEFKPSVILLQFIEQVKSDGGANTLVDGFNVVQHFKQQQPRYFDLMVSTAVLWQVIGTEKIYGDFRMMFPRPVIEMGWTGKVARINYNEPLREAFVNVSVDKITDIYHAYSALTKMFYDPQFVVKTKMSAGEMLTMDNDRLLHGRTAYEVHNNDRRWLHQAYIDWDILLSKMNVLKEKLQRADSIDN